MTPSLNKLDLNLLRVFDAVMDERSVLRASQKVCLSQSAVSHALARLRQMLGDDLFIRTTSGMQPTNRALTMAPLIREAWKSLEEAIGPAKFEPHNSNRRFTIAVSDFVTTVTLPNLHSLLKREAPLVDLVIQPDSAFDLAEQMDLGQFDAVIGTFSDVPARFRMEPLFAYDDVLIANSSRNIGTLSIEVLSSLAVAAVSLRGDRGEIVDGFVSQRGLSRRSDMYDRGALERALPGSEEARRIAISLPHFLALPALLERTGLVAIVPRPLGISLARAYPISAHDLPYETTPVDVSVLWHERTAKDVPQQWLREMLKRATEPLRSQLTQSDGHARFTSISRSSPAAPVVGLPKRSPTGKVARLVSRR